MARYIFPNKLREGDEVRIISPSYSGRMIPQKVKQIAEKRLGQLGLRVTYGKYADEMDEYESSSVQSRIDDMMDAFLDPKVSGVLAAIGGYNSNFLLDSIDWQVIQKNPKFFCGMSDITVLQNAILKKTGLVTYHGPNFRNFGQEKYFEYTLDGFTKVALGKHSFDIVPSMQWSDDKWTKDQEKRSLINNKGWWKIRNGKATGGVVGGNLCSINLLQGTQYMPDLTDSILFIEDDSMSTVGEFSRNWRSLTHTENFSKIIGVIFGRFQKKTKMSERLLSGIIGLSGVKDAIPVLGNVDFGHTDPKITFPVGGEASIIVNENSCKLSIDRH